MKYVFVLLCVYFGNQVPDVSSRNLKALPFELKYIQDKELEEYKVPDLFQRQYLYYLSGYDDEGRPIWIAEFGKWDIRQLLEEAESVKTVDRYVEKLVRNVLESLRLLSSDSDAPDEIIVLVDMEGYSLAQLASVTSIRYMIRKISELEPIAKRRVAAAYVINASFIAERFVNLIRPVLGDVMQRVEVYGTKRSVWMPKLLKALPKDQLPEWYGGNSGFKPVKVYG